MSPHTLPFTTLSIPLLLGTTLLFAVFHILRDWKATGDWEDTAVVLSLTLLLAWQAVKGLPRQVRDTTPSPWSRRLSWVILCLAGLLPLISSNVQVMHLALFCLLLAPVFFLHNFATVRTLCVLFIWCICLVPFREELLLLLSYPFRMIATLLSSDLLQLAGIPIVQDGTTMYLPGEAIAVTYACSGIQQLDIFLVLAYLSVRAMQPSPLWRLLHLSFIPLIIILANTLRLAGTVLLYQRLGTPALSTPIHTVLGIVQVLLGLALFYVIGKFLVATHHSRKEVGP